MNKKILIVLGVSLALNFLFIGFEVSRAVFEPPFPPMPEERFNFRPEGFPPPPDGTEMRPNADKKVFFGAFKEAMKGAREPMAASKKAVAEAVRKEPFDPAALKQALEEASAVRRKIDETVQDNMLNIISDMTPEERAAFANSFEKGSKHRRPRKHARLPMHHPEMMPPRDLPPCMRDSEGTPLMRPAYDCPCADVVKGGKKGKAMKSKKGGKAKPALQEGSTPQK